MALGGAQAGVADHRRGHHHHQGLGDRRGPGPGVGALDDMLLAAGDHFADAGLFERLAVVDLDDLHPVQALHHGGGEGGGLGHGAPGGLAGAPGEAPHHPGRHRPRDQHQDGEIGVLGGHHGDGGDDGQAVLGVVDHPRGGRFADQSRVVEHRGDEGARVGRVEPGEVGANQPPEQLALDVAHDLVTDPVHERGLGQLGRPADQGGGDDQQGDQDQAVGPLLDEDPLDHRIEHPGEKGGEKRHDHGAEEGGRHLLPPRREVGAHDPEGERPARRRGVGGGGGGGLGRRRGRHHRRGRLNGLRCQAAGPRLRRPGPSTRRGRGSRSPA